jgi:hypothetical protein
LTTYILLRVIISETPVTHNSGDRTDRNMVCKEVLQSWSALAVKKMVCTHQEKQIDALVHAWSLIKHHRSAAGAVPASGRASLKLELLVKLVLPSVVVGHASPTRRPISASLPSCRTRTLTPDGRSQRTVLIPIAASCCSLFRIPPSVDGAV